MSEDDYDIDGLADYLHLQVKQVQRMADRGRVPGRKVAGKWRFSRPEIHYWLERQIGVLDNDGQLAQMEGVLQRGEQSDSAPRSIGDILPLGAIAVPLEARTRRAVVDGMVHLAASTGLLWDPDKMIEAVLAREDMHPTTMPGGVALMHPRRPMSNILNQSFLALGRTVQAVPFGGASGQLTDIFFLICSVNDQGHLRTLARLTRLIRDEEMLESIRLARTPSEVHALLVNRESSLDA